MSASAVRQQIDRIFEKGVPATVSVNVTGDPASVKSAIKKLAKQGVAAKPKPSASSAPKPAPDKKETPSGAPPKTAELEMDVEEAVNKLLQPVGSDATK